MHDIITEAEQAAPASITPPKVPQFPQVPQQDGDLGQGQQAVTNKDGTRSLKGGQGEFTWDKNGKPLKYTFPSFSGVTQTVDIATGDITVKYGNGPMAISAVYDKTGKKKEGTSSVSADLGIAKFQSGPQGNTMTVRGGSPDKDQTIAMK